MKRVITSNESSAARSDSTQALLAYLKRLHREYVLWYTRSVRRMTWAYGILQALSVVASFLAAVVAAWSTADSFGEWGRFALIALPLVAGLAGTLLTQTRVHDLWRMREDGRIRFQGLVSDGHQRAAATNDPMEHARIHADLINKAQAIESEQAANFFGLYDGRLWGDHNAPRHLSSPGPEPRVPPAPLSGGGGRGRG